MRSPLAKVLILLVSGILVASFFKFKLEVLLLVELVVFVLLLILNLFKRNSNPLISSALLSVSIIVFGITLFNWNNGSLNELLANYRNGETQTLKGVVYNNPVNKVNTKLFVNVESLHISSKIKKDIAGRLYLNVKNSDRKFQYGDQIVFKTKVTTIKNKGNPGEFDFENYMIKKGIAFQGYSKEQDVVLVGNETNWFVGLALKMRAYMLEVVDNNFKKETSPIAKALLLGYKSDLDTETKSHYASSGASHILAVSGMHVGIIMLLISKINSIWARTARSKKIATIILLLLLWFYVFLTGFSPSILRAGLMFSLVIVGKLIQRDHSKLNLLSASAVILLIYDPFYLFDLGFQLSYLAVGGIFFIYPKLKVFYSSRFKLVNWLWELSVVSVSAQIATIPLTMYYFHQFPNAFLITNVVTTICATLILVFGMFFMIFQWIDLIAAWLSTAIGKIIEFMNYFVKWIDSFEYSVSKGIYLNEFQLIILLLMTIVFFTIKLQSVKQKYWLFTLIFFGVGVLLLAGSFNVPKGEELVVFNTQKTTLININKNGQNYFFTTDHKDKYSHSKLLDYWSLSGGGVNIDISEVRNSTEVYGLNGVVFFNGKSIIVLNNKNTKLLNDYNFDYIIVNQKAWIPKDIKNTGYWIVSGSLSSKKRQFLIEKLRRKKLPYYETDISGAFIMEL